MKGVIRGQGTVGRQVAERAGVFRRGVGSHVFILLEDPGHGVRELRGQTALGIGSGLSHEDGTCWSHVDAPKPQPSTVSRTDDGLSNHAQLLEPQGSQQRVGSFTVWCVESPVPRVHHSKVAARCKTEHTQ